MLTMDLGFLSLPAGRVMLMLSVFIAVFVAWVLGRRQRLQASSAVWDVLLMAIFAARLSFVVQYWQHYQGQWLTVLDIRDGGFDVVAGAIVAIVVAVILSIRKPVLKKPLLAALIVGLGCYAMQLFLWQQLSNSSTAMPSVMVQDAKQNAINLNALAPNKPKVVNLWATWCPPCVKEMPMLASAQGDYPDVAFIFVNQGEHQEVVQQFLQKQQLDLPLMYFDSQGVVGQTTGSHALPTTLFYDASGVLQHAHLGQLSKASLAHGLEFIRIQYSQQLKTSDL